MTISGFWPILLVGCLGGLMGEGAKWFQLRESPNLPDYVHKPSYWTITLFIILMGGVLAVFYGTDNRSAILIANIGLTAPLIIKTLGQTILVGEGRGTTRKASRPGPSILNFLAGR